MPLLPHNLLDTDPVLPYLQLVTNIAIAESSKEINYKSKIILNIL